MAVTGPGVAYVLSLFVAAMIVDLYVMTPLLILLFAGQVPLFRTLIDMCVASWFKLPIAMLELFYGVKMRFYGDIDKIIANERAVVIANHRTRLDWMFAWAFFWRFGRLENLKIALKNSLRNVPGAGWGIQLACFMFLHRDWATDQPFVQSLLNYFSAIKYPFQLLFFPEGTDLTPDTLKKSHAFAEQNNLPKFDHVLLPRTTGFCFVTNQLLENKALDAVYDITIAYSGQIPQGETALLKGQLPSEIHFHLTRHPAATLPSDQIGLAKWCNSQWSKKEQVLSEFYGGKGAQALGEAKTSPPPNFIALIVGWALLAGLVVYGLTTSSLVRWFGLASFVYNYLYSKYGTDYTVVQMRSVQSKAAKSQ